MGFVGWEWVLWGGSGYCGGGDGFCGCGGGYCGGGDGYCGGGGGFSEGLNRFFLNIEQQLFFRYIIYHWTIPRLLANLVNKF